MREINFLSSNKGKALEIISLGRQLGVRVKWIKHSKVEIQSDDPEEISTTGAVLAYPSFQTPLIVEDSALFIKSLNGFPGAYSSYAYNTIGLKGILRLMENAKDRSAVFKTAISYINGSRIKTFGGESRGSISKEIRNGRDFGYDPVFVPKGTSKAFSELSVYGKNRLSHRAMAFRKFAKYYLSERNER